jgi:hypothetical protein
VRMLEDRLRPGAAADVPAHQAAGGGMKIAATNCSPHTLE